MSCTICGVPNSFIESCETRAPGGNAREVYFAEACEIASYTEDPYNGKITSITMEGLAVFRKIVAKRLSVKFTQEHQENGSLLQTVNFQIALLSNNEIRDDAAQEASNFVRSLRNSANPLVMIVEQGSGVRYIVGYTQAQGSRRGLEISASTMDSGAAIADNAGTDVTFTFGAPTEAPVLDSTFVIPE